MIASTLLALALIALPADQPQVIVDEVPTKPHPAATVSAPAATPAVSRRAGTSRPAPRRAPLSTPSLVSSTHTTARPQG
jgi:hypothetical protein